MLAKKVKSNIFQHPIYGPLSMSVEPKFGCIVLYGGTKSIPRVFGKLE